MQRVFRICSILLLVLLASQVWAKQESWPTPVPNFKPVEAGEHPRLLFRKSDLPRLKQIAATPEGKALLDRLRQTLNGSDGESMPKRFGLKGPVSQDGAGDFAKDPPGTYTFSHAAGYGFLYQLTGDKKYAELGRQCFEIAFDGQRDRDRRYSFKAPFGALRAGPSLGWSALGYDLCYDGWDEAYRKKVASAIANYNEGKFLSLPELVKGARHHPGSNHWGMQVGGGAMAILSIMGDPGVDMSKIQPLLESSKEAMIKNMTQGFGDGGFFAEGDGTGSMSSHIVFLTALQAWRIAGGQDFVTPRWNAQWMYLKWPFLAIARGDKMDFWPQRGGYPHNIWARNDKSGAGYFGIAFGVATEPQRAGMKWFYDRYLKEQDLKAGTPYDAVTPYPHHAICSFVNWPWDTKEQYLGDVIPRCYQDSKWGFYAFRNRWQDQNDILISILTRAAKGYMGAPADGTLKIQAYGKKFDWGKLGGATKFWKPAKDGSAILTMADGTSLAVDFSKTSGADGMLVMTGPGAGVGTSVSAGAHKFSFKFLTDGSEPTPNAEGDKVMIGTQTVTLENGNLVLGKMAEAWE